MLLKWTFYTPRTRWAVFSLLFFTGVLFFQSCRKDDLGNNSADFLPKLSDYGFFKGTPSDLLPAEDMISYELATPLFSDYSEKQRLIRLPAGQKIQPKGDGLPEFPEGTILVKTFYYYHDSRDTSKGKNIIETRVLLKQHEEWKLATYLWNDDQNEALLFTPGLNKMVNWIDKDGKGRVIVYHVPSERECGICHRSEQSLTPIGPKLRNMNITVERNSATHNQLDWFQTNQQMAFVDPLSVLVLPDWENPLYTTKERARAYLDMNCAHCHNEKGYASKENFYPAYEETDDNSRIAQKKTTLVHLIESGQMPKAGTTVVHQEALSLIKAYVNSL